MNEDNEKGAGLADVGALGMVGPVARQADSAALSRWRWWPSASGAGGGYPLASPAEGRVVRQGEEHGLNLLRNLQCRRRPPAPRPALLDWRLFLSI